MSDRKTLALIAGVAALAGPEALAAILGSGKRRYPKGPCEICGKPNVRNGRERGIYRCNEHLTA